jgi:hypothetical protein
MTSPRRLMPSALTLPGEPAGERSSILVKLGVGAAETADPADTNHSVAQTQ